MSKFGIGPTLGHVSHQSSSATLPPSHYLSNSGEHTNNGNATSSNHSNHLPALSTIILSPKIQLKPGNPSLQTSSTVSSSSHRNLITESPSYPVFSKQHSSHYLTDLNAPLTTTLNGTNSVTNHANGETSGFNLPKLNKLPYYLLNLDDLEKSVCLMRTVQVPLSSMTRLTLKNDSSYAHTGSKTKPILIETTDLGLNFLPGDQLIEVNDEVVIYKSLNECKKLIDKLVDHDGVNVLIFKVKTGLVSSELILRNDGHQRVTCNDVLSSNGKMDTLKRVGSLKRLGKYSFFKL
jgi:hypothetical protein